MLLTEPKEPTPRSRRARRTPPPAPPLAATPFEGAAVLEELPGPLDGMLWQAARDVDLWLQLLPQDRKDLFGAECAEHVEWDRETDPELLDALEAFTAMRSQPEAVTRNRLLHACEHCYNWATRNSYLRTAVTFAELCASGAPEDANRQTVAGRANRQLGAFERAARWFDRAIALARVQGDQAALADALLTWGVSAFKRADYNAARKLFMRAWRRGKRFNLREVGAFARHNLLLLELPLENFAAAGEHGAAALQLYGPRHPRLPFLAHDLALL